MRPRPLVQDHYTRVVITTDVIKNVKMNFTAYACRRKNPVFISSLDFLSLHIQQFSKKCGPAHIEFYDDRQVPNQLRKTAALKRLIHFRHERYCEKRVFSDCTARGDFSNKEFECENETV